MGLIIIGVLAAALSVASSRHAGGAGRLAASRGATWAAEEALAQLSAGKPASAEGVKVERTEGGAAPAGHVWVRVTAQRDGRSASLVGLVPDKVLPPAAPAEGGRP
jgi:type II secretory pathway pseudopilin PulG